MQTNWAPPQRVPRTHSGYIATKATSGPVARKRRRWARRLRQVALIAITVGAVLVLAASGRPLP